MIYFNTYDLIINYFAHFVDEEIETQRLFGFPTIRESEKKDSLDWSLALDQCSWHCRTRPLHGIEILKMLLK